MLSMMMKNSKYSMSPFTRFHFNMYSVYNRYNFIYAIKTSILQILFDIKNK